MNESEHTRKKIMAPIRARGGWCCKKVAGPRSSVGMPDVTACYRGWMVGLEVKMPKAKRGLTDKQRDTLEEIRRAGGITGVVRTRAEVEAILDKIDAIEDAGNG